MVAFGDKLSKIWGLVRRKKVDPRTLQFESDVQRLFLATSNNHYRKNKPESDADNKWNLAAQMTFPEQHNKVQEFVHTQIQDISKAMDKILEIDVPKKIPEAKKSKPVEKTKKRSGLSFAVGQVNTHAEEPPVISTRSIGRMGLSEELKDQIGYTLELRKSQVCNGQAGQGLYLSGKANTGTVVSFYPGVIYSPTYYCYIPGYPQVDASNQYLISRYDGTVIDAQPWGIGGQQREVWKGLHMKSHDLAGEGIKKTPTVKIMEYVSKPQDNKKMVRGTIVERRNPLALGHYANHPDKGMTPNVIICPYDFPLSQSTSTMRPYIPNLLVGATGDTEEEVAAANYLDVNMKRYGSFWFKTFGGSTNINSKSAIRTLVLVATRDICDEEILLNYRLSNPEKWPSWYVPVDEAEDRRRWS